MSLLSVFGLVMGVDLEEREGGVVDVRVRRWNGSALREAGWVIV